MASIKTKVVQLGVIWNQLPGETKGDHERPQSW